MQTQGKWGKTGFRLLISIIDLYFIVSCTCKLPKCRCHCLKWHICPLLVNIFIEAHGITFDCYTWFCCCFCSNIYIICILVILLQRYLDFIYDLKCIDRLLNAYDPIDTFQEKWRKEPSWITELIHNNPPTLCKF